MFSAESLEVIIAFLQVLVAVTAAGIMVLALLGEPGFRDDPYVEKLVR